MSEWHAIDNLVASWRARRILSHIPPHSIVCDIGCGKNGVFLQSIQHRITKGYGFDRRVETSSSENIELCELDDIQRGIPLESSSCDCVVLLAVLEHFDYPEQVIAEVARILKPAGTLILTTPAPIAKPVLECLAFFRILNKDEIDDHKHYFSQTDLRHLLSRDFAGLDYRRFMLGMNQSVVAQRSDV